MGVEPQPQDIAGPSSRTRLVEAMAKSCRERGYEETTVENVLADAHVERRELERHFGGKEDCALAAVDEILTTGMAAIGGAYTADASEWESALQALRALLELFAARPAFADLAMIHSRQMMPRSAIPRYEAGFGLLHAMLDRLRSNQFGEADPPARAAPAAIGGGAALVRREIAGGRAGRLPAVLPDLVYSATVPFLGQEEALRLARRGRELVDG